MCVNHSELTNMHKRLFNLPPQFSRLDTQGPAFPFFFFFVIACLLMFVYVWVGLGFFLSLLTSSYDAINMFFHVTVTTAVELLVLPSSAVATHM